MTSVQVNIDKEMMSMVKCFRVIDLQELLGYAGRNKNGQKSDLLDRAMQMIKSTGSNKKIQAKIVELYGRRYPLQSTIKPSSLLHRSGNLPNDWCYGGREVTNSTPNYYHQQDEHEVAVSFKPLPFYEVLSEILPPKRLSSSKMRHSDQESVSTFSLKPHQSTKIFRDVNSAFKTRIQVQLRFCSLDTSSEQSDKFPPDLCVKINNCPVTLPSFIQPTKSGVPHKRQQRPLDITPLCQSIGLDKTFTLYVRWASPPGKDFVAGINLVRQLTVEDLLQKLEETGQHQSHITRSLIKQKLSRDLESDILTTSLKVSLLCPLGKMRMTLPTRPADCRHLQCFDAMLFLRMNEKKPTWICPVCDKPADFSSLRIDGLFMEILRTTDSDEIEFTEDGNWHCAKKKIETTVNTNKPIDLSSSNHQSSEVDKISRNVDIIDLTCDSSDDEEPPKLSSKSPIRASSNTPVSAPSSPLDLGYNKQRNGVLELPVSNAQLTSHRKSPQKITHKSYLSPASSPYCKSDSPLYKSRQSQAYPTKPFEYSRHTPSKQSTLPNQFSPISYSSKASTPNYQIPSPFVSGTPPSLNGVFPTAIQNFDLNLDRFSSFDPNFYLRYPHPAQLDFYPRFLNPVTGPGQLNPFGLSTLPFMGPYEMPNLPQSSSVSTPNSRPSDFGLHTPQLDLTDDIDYNTEIVD